MVRQKNARIVISELVASFLQTTQRGKSRRHRRRSLVGSVDGGKKSNKSLRRMNPEKRIEMKIAMSALVKLLIFDASILPLIQKYTILFRLVD